MSTVPDTTPEDHADDDDDMTEATVSDPDELEADDPQVDTEPPAWLVIAGLCDCNHVAVSIAHPGYAGIDLFTGLTHDDDVVSRGPRWQALVAPLAVTMAERSGLPISADCTSVYLPRGDFAGQPPRFDDAVRRPSKANCGPQSGSDLVDDALDPTEQEQAEQEAAERKRADEQKKIVDEVHRIVNRMRLPTGVKVVGRYDMCGSKHPSRDDAFCRRGVDHDGDHSAYTYRITVPETWPAVPVVSVDLDEGDVA